MMVAAYGLSKHFPIRGAVLAKTTLKAVDEATLHIKENQIVGLVGESGSGKSTLGRCLIRLLEPTSGEVLFNIPDEDVMAYEAASARKDQASMDAISARYSLVRRSSSGLRLMRRDMNVVFQDPYSSLNPRLRLADIISEPMLSTHFCSRTEAEARSLQLLREVGLPEFFEDRYPHELSGGQRQRVAVARAISTNPKLLILDEPTSALDVSVQAQILNLLRSLRDKFGISMLLITHNIAVVAYLAEHVYVMYAGKVMEWGDKTKILRSPQHPYTKALMSAVPIVGTKVNRTILRGDPPNLVTPPVACRFHPRCPVAFDLCGWTADEVVDDLEYVLTGKYFATFGEGVQLEARDQRTIVVHGVADAARVLEVVAAEKEESRSLQAIQSVIEAEGGLTIALHEPMDPPMYVLPDGRQAMCLLFRPEASPGRGSG